MGPNSHNNKVSIEIGMKNKQTGEKWVRIGGCTCLHAQASSPMRWHAPPKGKPPMQDPKNPRKEIMRIKQGKWS